MSSRLPQTGDVVQLFGIGCEGCGHFSGKFEVRSVIEGHTASMVVEPKDIHCDGRVDKDAFPPLVLEWSRDLECWQTDCGDHRVVVNIAGHYRGPDRAAA